MSEQKTSSRVMKALSQVPTDLKMLAEAYGLRVEETTIRGSSAIVVPREGNDGPVIEINVMDTERTKRFSLAYELARWALGRDKLLEQSEGRRSPGGPLKPVRHDSQSAGDRGLIDASIGEETVRITRIASEILMPTEFLIKHYHDNGRDLIRTAEAYQVSAEAVRSKLASRREI